MNKLETQIVYKHDFQQAIKRALLTIPWYDKPYVFWKMSEGR